MLNVKQVMTHQENVKEITLKTEEAEVKILTLGGTITSFKLTDDLNVVTSFMNYEDYLNNSVYLGSCIGPLAGRTRDGVIHSDETTLNLSQNNGKAHLHGGYEGLSTRNLTIKSLYDDDEPIVVLKGDFNHERDGYPGNVRYEIIYRLDGSSLSVIYTATPSCSMPLNLTNHMYFDLLGHGDLSQHHLLVDADCVAYLDEDLCTDGTLIDVTDTVFDLRDNPSLESVLQGYHPQFQNTRHLDHNYQLIGDKRVILSAMNKSLLIETSCPAVQIYFANYFDESFKNGHGQFALNHSAIAIEPEYLPGSCVPWFSEENPYQEITTYTLKK
ncbi:aldose epimerase [Erysipelothrix sp. strain 2 (EsS2-6-Brazil)]|uniref:aldose epimerase family protein n=1 Tax=Erysipelothrix sp. strain 2 (EsS2-6-Brazil) TaxID=2500549 RepID=UPI00190E4172|nr:aldose epimerase [Erysipelothrix sp. strain 2 (EsS2-6-Brazil)]MBK2402910.1 aldose epimerase [Erysipelothrix sp. strain 2 (EsS2-6-Brazil)]